MDAGEREALEQVRAMVNNAAHVFPKRTREIWMTKILAYGRAVRETALALVHVPHCICGHIKFAHGPDDACLALREALRRKG